MGRKPHRRDARPAFRNRLVAPADGAVRLRGGLARCHAPSRMVWMPSDPQRIGSLARLLVHPGLAPGSVEAASLVSESPGLRPGSVEVASLVSESPGLRPGSVEAACLVSESPGLRPGLWRRPVLSRNPRACARGQ